MIIEAKINPKDIAHLFDDVEDDYLKLMNKLVDEIVIELKKATPVDTGYAASRWSRDDIFKTLQDVVEIENDAEYINRLNDGYSQQAPAYFVEQTVFRLTGTLPK